MVCSGFWNKTGSKTGCKLIVFEEADRGRYSRGPPTLHPFLITPPPRNSVYGNVPVPIHLICFPWQPQPGGCFPPVCFSSICGRLQCMKNQPDDQMRENEVAAEATNDSTPAQGLIPDMSQSPRKFFDTSRNPRFASPSATRSRRAPRRLKSTLP